MLPPMTAFRRAFSTSSRWLIVGPESPKFAEVPTVKLPKTHPFPRRKGILPRPKNLFPATKPEKGTPRYLAAATPEPTRKRATPADAETKAFQEWQAHMAEKRRSNLREGLTELKAQKEAKEKKRALILKERNSARNEALMKAEREDVRLTLPSVLSTLRAEASGLPDPRRQERLEEMRERRERQLAKKQEERQMLLHELYVSASEFILTEAQLDKAIETTFTERDEPYSGNQLPPTMQEMLSRRTWQNSSDPEEVAVGEVGGALTGGSFPSKRNYLGKSKLGF